MIQIDLAVARNGIVHATYGVTELFSWTLEPTIHADDESKSTIREYLEQLNSRSFSCLLKDGSLVQISLKTKHDQIVWHRYNYYPCPIEIDLSDTLHEDLDLALYVSDLVKANVDKILLRTAIRFDYAPADARDGHPHSHLHLNSEDCRVAVSEPLSPREFVEFLFQAFYGSHMMHFRDAHAASDAPQKRCITIDEETYYHVNRRRHTL